jgi:hypothetical protein
MHGVFLRCASRFSNSTTKKSPAVGNTLPKMRSNANSGPAANENRLMSGKPAMTDKAYARRRSNCSVNAVRQSANGL